MTGLKSDSAQQGYQLDAAECTAFHQLCKPTMHTRDGWQLTLTEMFPKAKTTDAVQQQLIQEYVFSLSK